MAIDRDTLALWRFLVKDTSWWTAAQLTDYWRPTFTEDEVSRHLESLARHGFLARRRVETRRADTCVTQYSYTPLCQPLEYAAAWAIPLTLSAAPTTPTH